MNEQFLIDIGEKQGQILANQKTMKDAIIELKDYLLENGLVQQNAANTESIKRIWTYLAALFFLLLAVAGFK